ncbi:MAG: GNAT family N-acetyltransferase [Bacilli bacterium]|nr:GNAT family N-acetyltransferase [Bacilli bacterium]
MNIKLDSFCLNTYDEYNQLHRNLVEEFKGISSSKYVSQIENRLILNNKQKSFPFDTGFIISLNSDDDLVGYIFISSIRNDEVYLEYSILNNKKKMGYGKLVLKELTEYLFENFNIRDIALDIDVSNVPSVKTAISCGYYDEDYLGDKRVIYKNYNPNYLNKQRKRR